MKTKNTKSSSCFSSWAATETKKLFSVLIRNRIGPTMFRSRSWRQTDFLGEKAKRREKGGRGGIGASFESRSWTKEGTEIFFRDVKKIDSKKTFFFFGRDEISKIAEKESSQVEQNGSNLEICKNRQKLLLEPKCFSLKGQPVNLFQ